MKPKIHKGACERCWCTAAARAAAESKGHYEVYLEELLKHPEGHREQEILAVDWGKEPSWSG